ncbi:hypothetical protein DH2020_029487 [Rehmannia glutinosa]|uniref:SWI/SNF complex subunit SWI3D n=1 Tax=Rehmannia glutinosa TaxID=99300 RepID=A0ABR0VS21_REHGL
MTEVSPAEQPMSRRRGAGQKRKSTSINSSGGGSSTPQTTSSKRQAREKPPSALEAKIEAEYEAIRSRDANVHVVPIHAGWFSWTKIHPLEEKMLPSFFNGKSESRTPEIYMEIRNWIMKKFHLNPNEQIELKHLSELTVGKFDARQEVMEFLDYWGLINYHPFPHHEPTAMIVDADADKDEAGKKDSLVEKLFQFETVQSWTPIVPRVNTAAPAMSSGLYPDSAVADELVKSEGPAVEYHCNSCSADCSRKRYHCQKQVSLFLPLFFPFVFRSILSCSLIAYTYIFHEIYYFAEPICKQADFDLCADCFNNGKFGSNMHPSDFILMEPAEAGGVSGGNWTDQETLLLLEAIELFRDNWSEIAEHVATKTKAQCILHFVQMPIEDAFFNRDDENSDAPKENRVPVSTTTEDSAPKADRDCDTALKDVPENTEIQGVNTDNQDSSCPMEISKPDEVGESDRNVELEESFALKALKEAFEAVGSLPSPGERLSFAEAGNPVMTLAAFLVRLVEPNIANASVRSLLKYLSGNYSSEQLAARHCFPLQDPPDYKKNLANSEGAEAEAIEHDAQKNEVQHAEKQEETPDSIVDGISLRDDENDRNKDSAPEGQDEKKDSASKDQKPVASPSGDRADRSGTVKDSDKLATHEEAQLASESEPSSSDFAKEQARKDAEELVVPASHTELQSNSVKESDGASAGEATQSKELLKDEDMTTSISEKKEADVLAIPNSITEKENTGDREAKESVSEKKEPVVTKNELDVNDKLKRAAVTAISAAAVKAKFLADQEEDQILRLSTLLIEKQLYKLEAKLAFFNDMENVVMRVKEQLDRSKQKLFHERAQIIATRFGMSASARPTTQNLPPNRTAVNFPTSASRPFMGMNALRPPISRPMMSANPTSSTFMTASAPGSSMQPNTDRLSSVGMK